MSTPNADAYKERVQQLAEQDERVGLAEAERGGQPADNYDRRAERIAQLNSQSATLEALVNQRAALKEAQTRNERARRRAREYGIALPERIL